MSNRVFVATESGTTTIDGKEYTFNTGTTRVAEGHPLLAQCPQHFKPADQDVTFPLETADARSGRRGPTAAKPSSATASVPADDDNDEALGEKTREELDSLAEQLGIENPKGLPNKAALVSAIEAAQKG